MILRGVNLEKLEHLGKISTKIKTILTHYSVDQAGSNFEKKTGWKSCWNVPLNMIQKSQMTPRSMMLRRTWLHAVWYCAELYSVQYDTARNFRKTYISRRKRHQKRKYFNQLVSGTDQFEWWKKLGVENLVGRFLKDIFCCVAMFVPFLPLLDF